jgi:hypothetical protein
MKAYVCIASLLLLVAAAGCQQKADEADVKVKMQVEPSPPKVGTAKVTLELRDADDRPVEGATVKLEGNMSHAGMKPSFADARQQKPGVYEADLELTMAGDWYVVVSGKLADGKKFEKKLALEGVKAN